MSVDLNLLRSKTVGPAPTGPLGIKRTGAARGSAAGFAAGRSFGISKNKKASAGARAGIGHKGRSVALPTSTTGKSRVHVGFQRPGGPVSSFGRGNQSVRLPNRSKPPAAPRSSILGGFMKRFRKAAAV